eukprot:SAG22_NODE_2191_length_2860_cov_22.131112_1_plen_88_part_10
MRLAVGRDGRAEHLDRLLDDRDLEHVRDPDLVVTQPLGLVEARARRCDDRPAGRQTNNNNLGKKELANWWECRELAVSAAARSRPNTP